MREFYEISGYWKDTKEQFEGYTVTNYDDELKETDLFTDDDIFFYGLDENDLMEAVELKEQTINDFVITDYTKIIS